MTETKIYKHTSTNDDRDYDFLRNEGIEYIKQMAGNVWTDHNLHDPGITFLEVLCYAITDLGGFTGGDGVQSWAFGINDSGLGLVQVVTR